MWEKKRVKFQKCLCVYVCVCVFALARQVGPVLNTLMCLLCVHVCCVCARVCLHWLGLTPSLRGTIIAGNPLHGRLICFRQGHSIPVLPASLPPSLPFLFLLTPSQQGLSLSPYLILQRSLVHSCLLSRHTSLHPSSPAPLELPFSLS